MKHNVLMKMASVILAKLLVTLKQLETYQVAIYLATVPLAIFIGLSFPSVGQPLEWLVTPILAVLLYGIFSQIPFLELRKAFKSRRFIIALMAANFIFVPIIVWVLAKYFISEPILQLGVMMVLLAPCIDYVIVFTHLGKGNAILMLSATPVLLIAQILLLPVYLEAFLGSHASGLVNIDSFIDTFIFLIFIPMTLALIFQFLAQGKDNRFRLMLNISAWLQVPFMSATLFVVISSQIYTISYHLDAIQQVIPVYLAYMAASLVLGWM